MGKTLSTPLVRWGPVILWAGLIFIVSSFSTLPSPEVIWWDFILKKSAHLLEYGIFYFLVQRATNWHSPKKNYWLPALIVVFYALTDEYHQSFTPGRHPKISDVGYDSLGAFLSYLRINNFI